jgi:hypothetical protein
MAKHANNEFIGECLRFDDIIAKLQQLRENHFGADPEKQRRWDEVGSLTAANNKIAEVLDFLMGNSK